MTAWKSDEDVERYIAAMSEALNLTIDEDFKPNVIQFLKLASEMAEVLDQAPLGPLETEPASVFRLPEPDQ